MKIVYYLCEFNSGLYLLNELDKNMYILGDYIFGLKKYERKPVKLQFLVDVENERYDVYLNKVNEDLFKYSSKKHGVIYFKIYRLKSSNKYLGESKILKEYYTFFVLEPLIESKLDTLSLEDDFTFLGKSIED